MQLPWPLCCLTFRIIGNLGPYSSYFYLDALPVLIHEMLTWKISQVFRHGTYFITTNLLSIVRPDVTQQKLASSRGSLHGFTSETNVQRRERKLCEKLSTRKPRWWIDSALNFCLLPGGLLPERLVVLLPTSHSVLDKISECSR